MKLTAGPHSDRYSFIPPRLPPAPILAISCMWVANHRQPCLSMKSLLVNVYLLFQSSRLSVVMFSVPALMQNSP